jgi:hypothetical protein
MDQLMSIFSALLQENQYTLTPGSKLNEGPETAKRPMRFGSGVSGETSFRPTFE